MGVDGYRRGHQPCGELVYAVRVPDLRELRITPAATGLIRAHVIQDAIRVFGNNFIQLRGSGIYLHPGDDRKTSRVRLSFCRGAFRFALR